MKKNMGSTDKIIRIIVALVLIFLYATNRVEGTLGIVLLVLAGVFILTSLVSFCPLYAPFRNQHLQKELIRGYRKYTRSKCGIAIICRPYFCFLL
ncbi:MAG: DUF2892 domain-containing protein [Bacteroidetes bacterium]|nr:DUF2892 domain-containing protein [Bacteroidota bacterium]